MSSNDAHLNYVTSCLHFLSDKEPAFSINMPDFFFLGLHRADRWVRPDSGAWGDDMHPVTVWRPLTRPGNGVTKHPGNHCRGRLNELINPSNSISDGKSKAIRSVLEVFPYIRYCNFSRCFLITILYFY